MVHKTEEKRMIERPGKSKFGRMETSRKGQPSTPIFNNMGRGEERAEG